MGPYIEAEYADGFVLSAKRSDRSPYDEGRNIFHAILNGRPVEAHGPMVEWRLCTPAKTYRVKWANVAENARPICFKHMSGTWVNGEHTGTVMLSMDWGYQWNGENGENHQDVITIQGTGN